VRGAVGKTQHEFDCAAAHEAGRLAGAAVAFGLMGMAFAIDARTWHCSHNLKNDPDHPEGLGGCRGQTFIPADLDGPWVCWMCGGSE
jgi:hypothetical protein